MEEPHETAESRPPLRYNPIGNLVMRVSNPRFRMVAACALPLLAMFIAYQNRNPSRPPRTYSGTNNYPALLRATDVTFPDLHEVTNWPIARLRAVVGDAKGHMDEVQHLLATPVFVEIPTNFNDPKWRDTHSLLPFGHLMGLKARLELLDGQTNAAVRSLLETIRLGQAVARGGLILNGITGAAIEKDAAIGLRSIVSDVDRRVAREAARTLKEWELERDTAEDIANRDTAWYRKHLGFPRYLLFYWLYGSPKARKAGFIQSYQEVVRKTHELIEHLARHSDG